MQVLHVNQVETLTHYKIPEWLRSQANPDIFIGSDLIKLNALDLQ